MVRVGARGASVKVRSAVVDDAAAITQAQIAAWREAYQGVIRDETLAALDDNIREDRWRTVLRHGRHLVAESAGAVVGFASFGPARSEGEEGRAEVYSLYVHPDSWGIGAGRALMEQMEKELCASGYDEAMLWVLDDNPRARRFYERAGWHDDGGRDVYDGDDSGATIARYRLRLSERG